VWIEMKIFILLFVMSSVMFAKVYYSKVEPYEILDITSNVTGEVIYINEDKIGVVLDSKAYIKIDDILDKKELKHTVEKIENLKQTIKLDENIASNLKESLSKKRKNYEKVKELKIKSSVEKDREFYELISSENSYLSIIKEIYSLKRQVLDLQMRKAQLQKSIKDKTVTNEGYTLYSIKVKVGQVVTKLTPLASVADVSRAILTIYLDEKDIKNVKSKIIYIDGKKTEYKIDRILNIADSKNISKYMAQIVIKAPQVFSKLAKIELREK
jgi:multidrug resistance efflux pump